MTRFPRVFALASLGLATGLSFAPLHAGLRQEEEPRASIGQLVPDHAFRNLLGGDGRQRIAEFRGQPILIVNWTDSDFGRGASDKAEQLAKELVPEGLVSILLDTHNRTQDQIEASVMRLYPGNLSRLTRNQKVPIEYRDNGPPPDVALIGADGRLLIAGSYTSDFNKAAKQAKAELKRLRTGWGEHPSARAVRAMAFGKQRLAEARALIEEALDAEPDHPELLEARAELMHRHRSWMSSVDHLMEKGELIRALGEARALAEAVEGNAEWEERATAALEAFDTPEARRELELDGKLTSLLKPLRKKKPRKGIAGKLRSFAGGISETRVGARALHIAKIAELAVAKE